MYILAIKWEEKMCEYSDAYWVDAVDFYLSESEYLVNLRRLLRREELMLGVRNIKGYGGDLGLLEIDYGI